jgi:hypothetical protein
MYIRSLNTVIYDIDESDLKTFTGKEIKDLTFEDIERYLDYHTNKEDTEAYEERMDDVLHYGIVEEDDMSSKVLIQVKNKGFDDIIYSMERE